MSSNPIPFFRPAERLLARLALPGKILLMGFAFLVVIALLSVLFGRSQWSALEATRQEHAGAVALVPMVDTLHSLQRHRGLRSRVLNGDSSARAALDQARAAADAAFAAVAGKSSAELEALGLAGEWRAIAEAWQQLAHTAGASPREDFAAHGELIARSIAFIGLLADASGLTLDPSLATYYLMDAAVFRLPGLVENAAQARGIGGGIAARKTITLDERVELASRHASFKEHLAAIGSGLDKVRQADPQLAGGLAAERAAVAAAGEAFERLLLGEFVRSAEIAVDPAAAFDAGTRAVDAGFSLWRRTLEMLSEGLAARALAQETQLWLVGGVTLSMLLLASYLFVALRRSVSAAAAEIAGAAHRIAGGDLTSDLAYEGADEFASIARSLNEMRADLAVQIDREHTSAIENLRIRNALDRASVSLMLADAEGRIIYMNESVSSMLRASETEIRQRIPGFSVDSLVGRSFDDFHRHPAHQRGILASLTGTHATQIEVGSHTFLLKASPVLDAAGNRLGTVLEWNDRTGEVAAEGELQHLVAAALSGDFGHRLDLAGKRGFFLQLAEGMNRLMGVVAGAIDDVGAVLNSVARGDLTQKVATEYEGTLGQLKEDVNTTVDRLREVVGRIQEVTEAINTAAQEISAGNTDLSSRTEEQASSLQETASSMEELNATVRQNADNARTANELAHGSNAVAERGGEMMTRVVSTMSSIQESARKIADIIGVIDSIAFQTNILALNAAVEAARAGEQGRGFAVVASEVRSLAQRSAQAAKEIKGLIADSGEKVEDGAKLVGEAGRTMEEVVSNFQRLAGLVTEIANASREQSSGIEQVTRAVSQMDEVTQQNAALVEEAAAAAESLQEQAAALVRSVGAFHLRPGDGGVPASATLAAPAGSGTSFDGIIHAHMQWKNRLRAYLAGSGDKLDPKVVECDDKCELGGWIYGEGRRFERHPPFTRLRSVHADFHKCAARIIRCSDQGDTAGARGLLSNEFARLADATVRNIRELHRHVEADGAAPQGVPRSAPRAAAAPLPKVRRGANAAPATDEWEEF